MEDEIQSESKVKYCRHGEGEQESVEVLTDEERSDVFSTRSLFADETNILHELL
jgi:hypothetical protein